MSFADERQTIENRFNAEWTATPIAYDNVPFNPPANSDWVRLNIQNGDSGYRSLESTVRHTGIISVQIFTPVNKATKTSRQYADIAADIFSDQRFGDVVTDVSSISIVDDDESWLQTNVTTPYYRDARATMPKPAELHTHLVLEYPYDSFNFEAEVGDFATHESLGWGRSQSSIDLSTYNGLPVFIVPDNTPGLYEITLPKTFNDIQNLHWYGGVFGGIIALNPIIAQGSGGMYSAIETNQATSLLDLDGTTQPFANTDSRRLRVRFFHDGNHCSVTGEGILDILLNGIVTVDVTDWKGDIVTNTVPEVLPGDFIEYELHVRDGLDKTMFLYVNRVLIANPEFLSGGQSGNQLIYSSGSGAGTNRISYIRKFGAGINTSSSELSFPKADLESSLSLTVLIPNGTRNYLTVIDKNLNLSTGYRFNFVSQTTGLLSWNPKDETGLSATIDGYSTNSITLKGLQEFHYVNILQNGAQSVSPTRLERDFSRFDTYLPIATPFTTPTLAADTPTKLLIPLTHKTTKDFSFDLPNLRWFLDLPSSSGKWFLAQASATITTSMPNQTVALDLYKNGVIVEGIGTSSFVAGGASEASFTGVGVTQFSHTDYFELYITITATGTVTFKRLSVNLNEMVGAV